MTKLKLGSIEDEKPVKLTIEVPAKVHRDLTAYADLLRSEGESHKADPARLIVPMLERFMSSDRAFRVARRKF